LPRLRGRADLLAEHTAVLVDRLEINFLRKIEPDFVVGDLARDQHDRSTIAVRFEQAVDEVQASRTARARARGQVTGEHRLRPGSETADFLVPYVDPFDRAAPDGVGDIIEGVPNHPVAALDTG
jgi:hypothetical protein